MARPRNTSEQAAGTQESSTDAIRSLAYDLYCENGRQDGHEIEHWLEAERRLQSHRRPGTRKAA